MLNDLLKKIEPLMERVIEHFKSELAVLHTGRATSALVENIKISYYGTSTPINHLGSITIPQANLIIIQPWDKQVLSEIVNAINNSELGLIANSDGEVIRVTLPSLTSERREELIKIVSAKAEEARISIRNIRREAWDKIQEMEKNKEISEDDKYRGKEQLQKLVDKFNKKIDELVEKKEKEITII